MTALAADTLLGRARDFTLASLAVAYPSPELLETFGALRDQIAAHPHLRTLLARLDEGVDGLRSDYLRCFDVGSARVPMYETEYGRMRGLSKGKDLADVLGFYQAFGFSLSEDQGGELPDHLAVELEFYALMLYKQSCLEDDRTGSEIVEDARRKFLEEHLGGFVVALASRPGVQEDPVYGPITAWCAALVVDECRRAQIVPAPLDFFAGEPPDEPANCGGCVAIPGTGIKES